MIDLDELERTWKSWPQVLELIAELRRLRAKLAEAVEAEAWWGHDSNFVTDDPSIGPSLPAYDLGGFEE